MDKINRPSFLKQYLMGTVQPELFHIIWKNGELAIYLEKVDEFGERMSNVELRIFSSSSVECYDSNYGYSPYRYELLTKPCVLCDDGNGNFDCSKYSSHNFEKNPLTFKNADITQTNAYSMQFKPINQPIVISGLKAGNYIIDEVNVFDSEYLYDSSKSRIYITIDENGNLLNVKALVISRGNYEYYGKEYYDKLELPNQAFEYFENPDVQNVLIIKQDWIKKYPNNLCQLINYEKLFYLRINHYVSLNHDLSDIQHMSKIKGINTIFQILSNRDITTIRSYNNTLSGIDIINSKDAIISINQNNIQDFIYNGYIQWINNLRTANYVFHEIEPPICYEYEDEHLNCYNLNSDINFKINNANIDINIYHNYPTIKFLATWVQVPDGVCTNFIDWELFTNSNYQDVLAYKATGYYYGNSLFGIKIYVDDQYYGYFTYVECVSNYAHHYFELNKIASGDINMYSCPKKDNLPQANEQIFLVPIFPKKHKIDRFYSYTQPINSNGEFTEHDYDNLENDLTYFLLYGTRYDFRRQIEYSQQWDFVCDKSHYSSSIGEKHETSQHSASDPFLISQFFNDIDINNLTIDNLGESYCYLGDGLTKEKLQMLINMQCNISDSIFYRYGTCEIEK